MAKVHSGILDGMSGKLGNIVARMRQGTQVYAVYQPIVNNPNTEAQQAWRFRFNTIVQLGRQTLGFINIGYKNTKKDGQSAFNIFMQKNINDVFTGTWPTLTLSYSKLMFSDGHLDLPFNPAATASESSITFTWTDNSGIGSALATDLACILVYNKSQHTSHVGLDVAARTAATYSWTFPTAWAGDEVELYFFMTTAGHGSNSPSVYLGNITL